MSGCTHDCNQGRNCTCQIAVAQPSRQTPRTFSLLGQDQTAEMLLQPAEQLSAWLAANSPGGWIDDLRRENAALKADAGRLVVMSEYLIGDTTEHDDAILAAKTVDEMRLAIDAIKDAT